MQLCMEMRKRGHLFIVLDTSSLPPFILLAKEDMLMLAKEDVRLLVSEMKCEPSVKGEHGDAPIHTLQLFMDMKVL